MSPVATNDFVRTFCAELDLPGAPWVDAVAARVRMQLED